MHICQNGGESNGSIITGYSQDLCPEDSTVRRQAAQSFYRILKMEKQGRLQTNQERNFGPIMIQLEEES